MTRRIVQSHFQSTWSRSSTYLYPIVTDRIAVSWEIACKCIYELPSIAFNSDYFEMENRSSADVELVLNLIDHSINRSGDVKAVVIVPKCPVGLRAEVDTSAAIFWKEKKKTKNESCPLGPGSRSSVKSKSSVRCYNIWMKVIEWLSCLLTIMLTIKCMQRFKPLEISDSDSS